MMKKLKQGLMTLLAVLIAVWGSLGLSQTVTADSPKELSHVISDIAIWDINNGRYAIQNGGVYQLFKDTTYRFETKFDLSDYNGNLSEGDYFTFNIPEPFTIKDQTFDLVDDTSKIVVGDVTVTSKGEGQGGVAKIVLKNFDDYLAQTGGVEVRDVKGTFYTDFTIKEATTQQTINYTGTGTALGLAHTLSVQARTVSDYTDTIGSENMAKVGGVLRQQDWDSPLLGKKGTYLHPWRIRVNTRQETYGEIVIKDSVSDQSAPMQFIPETLTVTGGYYETDNFTLINPGGLFRLQEGVDYEIEYDSTYTSFSLKILNTSTRIAANGKPAAYYVSYSTTSPADGSNVVNNAEMLGDGQPIPLNINTVRTVNSATRTTKITTGGNIQITTAYRLTIYKRDADTAALLAGAEFELTSPSGLKETIVIQADGIGRSQIYSAEEVAKGAFTLVETKAPAGYILDPTPMQVRLGKDGAILNINNKKDTVTIPVKKVWDDANNQDGKRPTAITVQLYANDVAVVGKTVTLDQANNWTAQFDGLEKVDAAGATIQYTVKEVDAPAGYTVAVGGDVAQGYTITNTYTPAVTEVSGTKTWDDANNQDGKRPAQITVNLLANGAKVDSKVVTEVDGWSYTFTNLPKYANGQEIVYTIEEEAVAGYASKIDGTNITNSYSPEKIDIAIEKNWDDANNQDGKRPDKITVELYADDVKVDAKEITPATDGTWTTNFTGLPKYKDGKEIVYTIKEVAVDGYTAKIDGANGQYTITNSYTPEKIELEGQKTWNDGNNQDGKRPADITLELLADGVPTGLTVVASADTNWSYKFSNLDRYKDGKAIVYTVKEVTVPAGYTSLVNGLNVTNSYTPELTSVAGQKTWDDANNQDGIRPKTITVHLLANGEETGLSVTTTANQNWAYRFENVAKFKDGKEIVYTVREDAIAGYEAKVDGMNITNVHAPQLIDLSGTKTWDDGDDQAGLRPAEITVRLLADGKDTGLFVKVTAASNWTYSFKALPKFKDGKEIVYSVSEDPVDGYTAMVVGMNITNSLIPNEPPTPPTPPTIPPGGNKKVLPKTNARDTALYALIGMVMLLAGIGFVHHTRKED